MNDEEIEKALERAKKAESQLAIANLHVSARFLPFDVVSVDAPQAYRALRATRAALREAREAMVWAGSLAHFRPKGRSRRGALRVLHPAIVKATAALGDSP
jgi:hypothetical protein